MGDTINRRAESEGRTDIHQRITDQIAAAIEAGAGKWRMLWHHGANGAAPMLPVNAVTGKPYRGVNTVMLWVTALLRHLRHACRRTRPTAMHTAFSATAGRGRCSAPSK